jgi:hypothetical protein
MPRYNTHFVPVKYCGRVHCVTGWPLLLDTDYQAAVEGVDASESLLARALIPNAPLSHDFFFFREQRLMSWLHYLPSKRCLLQLFVFDLPWGPLLQVKLLTGNLLQVKLLTGNLLQAMEGLLYSLGKNRPRTLFPCSRLPLPPQKVSLVHPRAILLRCALLMVGFSNSHL